MPEDPDEKLLAFLHKVLETKAIRPEYRVSAGSILLSYEARWASNRGLSAGIDRENRVRGIRSTLREIALSPPGGDFVEDASFKSALQAASLVLL